MDKKSTFILEQPLVTVVIPSYNHERYVEQAILSVVTQTYKNIQLIVIDDGSKDGTRDVVHRVKDRFEFEFIENEKNVGLTKSLNVALKHVRGKYLAILAGDDYWVVEKTQKQVDFMEQFQDVAVCSGAVVTVNAEGVPRKKRGKQRNPCVRYCTFEDFLLLKANFPAVVTMARVSNILQVGGYDERFFMEDTPLWLKLSSQGFKLAVLSDVLGNYRLHTNNLHKNREPMFDNHFRMINEYRDNVLYPKALRALYSREARYGMVHGWRRLSFYLIHGFSPTSSYFKDVMYCIRSVAMYLGGK